MLHRRKTKLLHRLTDLPHAVGNIAVVDPFERSFLLIVRQSDPVEPLRTNTRLLLKIRNNYPVADPGFLRGGGANHKSVGVNLLF